MRAIGEHPAVFDLKKSLQIHAGKHPAVFFGLYRLTRNDRARTQMVNPETQLVIEGFPRSANTFAVRAFEFAQPEKVRVAHHLHVPAQVIRAARWRIPTLVLLRKPKDAVLSLAVRDPVSVDRALRHYVSFYETVWGYRDAFVLGLFEEVTEDYGAVIERVNARFGTGFSAFRHDKRNVKKVFTRIDRTHRRKIGGATMETKVSRPSVAREIMKDRVRYETPDPDRKSLIARAENVYARLARDRA